MENSINVIIVYLAMIAIINVVVGAWVIYMSTVFDKHLTELRISLNELHIRWIDTFDVREGGEHEKVKSE